MDFNQYQNLAQRTARKEQPTNTRIIVSALGITGEAGEIADHIKKWQGQGHELNHDALISEMGDVLWYLAEMCSIFGITLESVAQENIEKLEERYPYGFDADRSINRDDYSLS